MASNFLRKPGLGPDGLPDCPFFHLYGSRLASAAGFAGMTTHELSVLTALSGERALLCGAGALERLMLGELARVLCWHGRNGHSEHATPVTSSSRQITCISVPIRICGNR